MHITPFPEYPVLHAQLKPPALFKQVASLWQLCPPPSFAHSLLSNL